MLDASLVCVPRLSLSECVWDTWNQCAHVDSVDDRRTNAEFSSGDYKTMSHSNQPTLKNTIASFNYMVTFERKPWPNLTENFFNAVVLKVWRHAFLINCWWSRFLLHCLLSCTALSRKSKMWTWRRRRRRYITSYQGNSGFCPKMFFFGQKEGRRYVVFQYITVCWEMFPLLVYC